MSDKRDFTYFFKIVFFGDSQSGVDSIVERYIERSFSTYTYRASIGVDFKIKTINSDNEITKLQIWVHPHHRFRNSLISAFFRNSHGLVFVYDVTEINSFNKIKNEWYQEYCKIRLDGRASLANESTRKSFGCNYENYTPPIMILGTKCDLRNKDNYHSCVDFDMVREYAQSINAMAFEVSSKENDNIEESIGELISSIKICYLKNSDSKPSSIETTASHSSQSKCKIN